MQLRRAEPALLCLGRREGEQARRVPLGGGERPDGREEAAQRDGRGQVRAWSGLGLKFGLGLGLGLGLGTQSDCARG